jgi:predicted small secreted protein
MNRALILAAALVLTLAGCNTVSGLGQDMQVLGGAMSDSASDLQGGAKTSAGTDCTMDAHGRPQGPGCNPPLTDDPPPLKAPE